MNAAKILVHTCCAPCFAAPYSGLADHGMDVTAWWFNPNIHPFTEYQKRLQALLDFTADMHLPLILRDEYRLDEFLMNVAPDPASRCEYCYRCRLEELVRAAKEQGFDCFSTTLLYSKYQLHNLIVSICRELSERYEVVFYYDDWRRFWQRGIELSKAAGMYRQQYCGCIYSEKDRYLGKK
ncbi:MAG: epoxyqueuosine reductase QueH [Candidatus Cloacimonetes bacterium]|nr:epoxyqueuosine reductase QueH [Candidatus Cloacimonadota bacterium]